MRTYFFSSNVTPCSARKKGLKIKSLMHHLELKTVENIHSFYKCWSSGQVTMLRALAGGTLVKQCSIFLS